jgi:transmembrane sensor
MDELIDRARRREASEAELAKLDAWRRESPANERQYRDIARLLDAGRALAHVETASQRPSPSTIIARVSARRRGAGRWTTWTVAAAAAAVLVVVAIRSRATVQSGEIPGWRPAEVATGAGELTTVALGEGSVVRLAPSSRLRVRAGRERVVDLEGRAFFAVQRMPSHPLIIHTRAGDARVLGTRFELATTDERLEVRVVEGTVALTTPRTHVEVGAGQQGMVQHGDVSRATPAGAPAAIASWVGRFLAFQATPLGEAAREIERVYGTPVTIADSALARETITATFTDRPVEDVLNVVCSVLSARCAVTDGHVRIER